MLAGFSDALQIVIVNDLPFAVFVVNGYASVIADRSMTFTDEFRRTQFENRSLDRFAAREFPILLYHLLNGIVTISDDRETSPTKTLRLRLAVHDTDVWHQLIEPGNQ